MSDRDLYVPGPASGARVTKEGVQKNRGQWTLILVRELSHPPEKVWQALQTRHICDATKLLEYDDTRWELEATDFGTCLTLWHNIDRRFIAWGAAGWHIAFDVLDRLLSGIPIGRIAGPEAMKFSRWHRLVAEYAKQFAVPTPTWPP